MFSCAVQRWSGYRDEIISSSLVSILDASSVDFFTSMRCHRIRDSFPPKRCHTNSSPFPQDSRSLAETYRLHRLSVVVESVGDTVSTSGIHRGIQNALREYGIPIHNSLGNRVWGYLLLLTSFNIESAIFLVLYISHNLVTICDITEYILPCNSAEISLMCGDTIFPGEFRTGIQKIGVPDSR